MRIMTFPLPFCENGYSRIDGKLASVGNTATGTPDIGVWEGRGASILAVEKSFGEKRTRSHPL